MKQILLLLLVPGWFLCAPALRAEPVSLSSLVNRLVDPALLPVLGDESVAMESSSDITGEDNDFLERADSGREEFVTLAELKGPGYVSRVWMKNWGADTRLVRIHVDEASTPIELTVGELFGGREPFIAPWSRRENGAGCCLLPMPFQRSWKIQIKAGAPGGALHFQINHTRLPKGAPVEALRLPLDPAARATLASAALRWPVSASAPETPPAWEKTLTLAAGEHADLPGLAGPGRIVEMRLRPEGDSASQPLVRPRLLRDVVISAYWDGAEDPSIEAPLGDFFGQVWRATRMASRVLGSDGREWFNRFPMPYDRSARLHVANEGNVPQSFTLRVWTASAPNSMTDGNLGYFHAGFQRSEPEDVGPEHPVLRIRGDGRYVGCLLSVVSRQEHGWGLEGDDSIRVDAEQIPGWRGTGVEDAFNAGGKHPSVVAHPDSGLLVRVPHKTVQYRFHALDAPRFRSSIDVQFERGGRNTTPLHMESTAFYYLRKPQAADTLMYSADARLPPAGQWDAASIMVDLGCLERLGDLPGAAARIEEFNAARSTLELNPFLPLLQLRREALLGSVEGAEAVVRRLAALMPVLTNADARAYASDWLWLHEKPSHAVVAVYAHPEVEVFLDGKSLGKSGSRDNVRLLRAEVLPGRHALALASTLKVKNPWLHAMVLVQGKPVLVSDESWRRALAPEGEWSLPGYEDRAWTVLAPGDLGPTAPFLPNFSLIPHPVPGFPSLTRNIALEVPEGGKTHVYRGGFAVP